MWIFFASVAILLTMKHFTGQPMSISSKFLSVRQHKCSLAGESSNSLWRRQNNRFADMKKMISLAEARMPNMDIGPPKTASYNPNPGFEPYWLGGDWVVQPMPNKTNDMCGLRCSPMYEEYGVVCGVDKDMTFKTYKNYCALKDDDCTGYKKMHIAHQGACVGALKTYPSFKFSVIISDATSNIAKFNSMYPKQFRTKPYPSTPSAPSSIDPSSTTPRQSVIVIRLQDTALGQGYQTGRYRTPGQNRVRASTTRHYDPNYGFKQYWPGGDWVPHRTTTLNRLKKTPANVCGEDCPEDYEAIGPVCVRNITVFPAFGLCKNCRIKTDNLFDYQTLSSYCEFLSYDCPNKRVRWHGFQFIHVGRCAVDQNEYFKSMSEPNDVVSRMKKYISNEKKFRGLWKNEAFNLKPFKTHPNFTNQDTEYEQK